VSPIASILNDFAENLMRLSPKAFLDVALVALMVICAIVVGIVFAHVLNDKIRERTIKHYTETSVMYNAGIGLMLGSFTAYLQTTRNIDITSQLLGVSIAITLLPPLVDMGLRLGASQLRDEHVWSDLKISAINASSFVFGAVLVKFALQNV